MILKMVKVFTFWKIRIGMKGIGRKMHFMVKESITMQMEKQNQSSINMEKEFEDLSDFIAFIIKVMIKLYDVKFI